MLATTLRKALRALLIATCATGAHATADGPDHWKVTGVEPGDVLNMRAGPTANAQKLADIPAEADGIMSFGCIGGLSFQEWEQASIAERDAGRKTRWCLVGYDRVIGWSAGWYLTEGRGPDTLNAGGRLSQLAGSEWRVRDFAGEPSSSETWIAFSSDGQAAGNGGCNRFTTRYVSTRGDLDLSPTAITRMACPEPQMNTEVAFMHALSTTHRIVATHLILTLLSEDNAVLATLERRDPD